MNIPIVFIFIGNKIPDYAYYSLRMNRQYSNVDEIFFVSNCFPNRNVDGITFIDFSRFYKSKFENYFEGNKNSWWSGFWNKTIERFFVLEAFMMAFDFDKILHVELDNICFDINNFNNVISKSKEGLYYPTYIGRTSAASLLFVNGLYSLSDFNQFILKHKNMNDMELLYSYKNYNSSNVHNLPTSANDTNHIKFGITDLNSLGQYFFGRDKRILNTYNKNLFISDLEVYESLLAEMYICGIEGKSLFIFSDNNKIKINNFHVHSKIHKKLIREKYLNKLIESAVNKKSTIIEINFYYAIKNIIIKFLLRLRKVFIK
jgi:hypothetical protein